MESTSTNQDKPFTMDMLLEAQTLLKALTPKGAPDNLNVIFGQTGLRIIKNKLMPNNTVIVSNDLFDVLFSASKKEDK